MMLEARELVLPIGPELRLHAPLDEGPAHRRRLALQLGSSAAYSGGSRSGMVAISCATFISGPLRLPSALASAEASPARSRSPGGRRPPTPRSSAMLVARCCAAGRPRGRVMVTDGAAARAARKWRRCSSVESRLRRIPGARAHGRGRGAAGRTGEDGGAPRRRRRRPPPPTASMPMDVESGPTITPSPMRPRRSNAPSSSANIAARNSARSPARRWRRGCPSDRAQPRPDRTPSARRPASVRGPCRSPSSRCSSAPWDQPAHSLHGRRWSRRRATRGARPRTPSTTPLARRRPAVALHGFGHRLVPRPVTAARRMARQRMLPIVAPWRRQRGGWPAPTHRWGPVGGRGGSATTR